MMSSDELGCLKYGPGFPQVVSRCLEISHWSVKVFPNGSEFNIVGVYVCLAVPVRACLCMCVHVCLCGSV